MSSHADLHPLPEADLPSAQLEIIERIHSAQEAGVTWSGTAPVRHIELDGVTFVREDTGKRSPSGTQRVVLFGAVGVSSAFMGLFYDGAVGTALLTIGALCLVACVWWLVRYPMEKDKMRNGPTRRGLYLFDDTLVIVGEPVQVIHRSEACGAFVIPKGAVTAVEVVDARSGEDVRYDVVLRVRKTTGEMADRPLEGYGTAVRHNTLGALLEQWLAA